MAERDPLFEEANEDLSDKIIDYGFDVAAAGVAAATFYRAGGRSVLSKWLPRKLGKARAIYAKYDALNYDHMNKGSLKKLYEDARKIFDEKEENLPINLSGRAGTPMESVMKSVEFENKGKWIRREIARQKAVDDQVLAYAAGLMQNYPVTKAQREHLNSYIRSTAKHLANEEAYKSPAKILEEYHHDKSGSMLPIYEAVSKKAVELNERFKETYREANVDGPEAQIAKWARDPETLQRLLSKNAEKVASTITGDRAATFRDILKDYESKSHKLNHESLRVTIDDKNSPEAFSKHLKMLATRMEKGDKALYEKFLDTVADPLLRIDKSGNFYSFYEVAGIKEKAIKAAAGTVPGKILKLRDIDMSSQIPSVFRIARGSVSPALAAIEGSATNRVNNDYYYLGKRVYRYDYGSDSFEHIAAMDNALVHSTRYGGLSNLHRDIMGLNAERENTPGLLGLLGLGRKPSMGFWETFKSWTSGEKDPLYVPNILRDIQRGAQKGDVRERYEANVALNEFLQKSAPNITMPMVKEFRKVVSDKYAQEVLAILEESTNLEDLLERLLGENKLGDNYNNYLNNLLSKFKQDQLKAKNSVDIVEGSFKSWVNGAAVGIDFEEQLRRGLAKEFFFRMTDSGTNYDAAKKLIESANLTFAEEEKAKAFAYVSMLDREVLRTSGKYEMWYDTTKDLENTMNVFENVLSGKDSSEGRRDAARVVKNLTNDSFNPSFLHAAERDRSGDIPAQYTEEDFVFLKESFGPLKALKAINQSIQESSLDPLKNGIMEFGRQLAGGRDNAGNASLLTLFPYFFMRRLGAEDMPSFLQFSNDELASNWGLVKGIAKRLAIPAIGETYLEWGDDTFGAITGTRASAAIVNSFDYMDIGTRKLLDTIGVGGFLEEQMKTDPILQYWFGKDGYYDADEQREYYANGYEAVRAGRYWNFGSVNEFRGNRIEYYQPNLTRRLNSDYYNKSLYNGYWDKWSHSLLPTPAMPLSPLIYMMDPYYLEEEHKEDRPYPVTGTMFAKDTPWGIILNPTIGELIKPVQPMHQDRLEDGVDVKAIIYSINKHIRDTADGNHAYAMVFDREQITAGEYTGYSSPTMGEYNVEISRNKFAQWEQRNEAIGGSDVDARKRLYSASDFGGGGEGSGAGGFFSFGDGTGNGAGAGGSGAIDIVGQTNRHIRNAASLQGDRGGIITSDRMRYSKMENVMANEDINDLLTTGKGGDLVDEMATSFRLISGIYGYGANKVLDFAEYHKRIADASDIDSFSRSFWDEAIGGVGGGAAEIGRRFIPEFRRNNKVNPLLNTMPDWIPENLRIGDAFSSLPKGEARLPGKGYEALNELHPDEYGLYGAYDRYKILADVAPNSVEFKVWKNIANRTVKDPALKADMEKIQERVNEANKQHDFYPYRILGEGVDYQDVSITEVNNDGTFRVQGSNELFRIAGIERTEEGSFSKAEGGAERLAAVRNFIQPGMEVTIATDSNEYHKHDTSRGDHPILAAVYVDGESISQQILETSPYFKKKKEFENAADTWAMTTSLHRTLGGVAEMVAHLDLPYIHDKYLRVRSPLESYKAEQVYGTPYQTWGDILGTYIFPAYERSVSDHFDVIKSTAEFFVLQSLKNRQGIGHVQSLALSGASWLVNRGAFMGGMMAQILKMGDAAFFEKGQKIGLAASFLGNLYTSAQTGAGSAAMSWGAAGFLVGDLLDAEKESFIKEKDTFKKFLRNEASIIGRTKYAAAGAAVGVLVSGMISENDGRDHWTPERVKQKWDLEDYFDRLTYIKYMGLYHKAAEMSKSEEGIDIEKIFADQEEWKEKRKEIIENSNFDTMSAYQSLRRTVLRDLNKLRSEVLPDSYRQNHRFEFDNGFSINDLPGVRNGIFHSEEVTEEERLYTLNALVTLGAKYAKPGTTRGPEDRDMTQLTAFEHAYGVKIPDYYEVHHIIEFSDNGPDNPANMIALHPNDHLYITEMQHSLAGGDFEAAQIGARTALRVGEYGRAALLYKKAAEATMYGLQADARWTDVVKALPKYERDYFTEFMKEKDPDKQEEILKVVSPFVRRALKQVWDMDYEEDKGPDNEEYFQSHNLPNFMWEGWNPDSDLNKVKAKTIKNEGMLFSDFGIYESTYKDQEVINAPNLSPKGGDDPITVQTNLAATLSGLGLTGVDVSVSPKSTKGIQSVINLTRVTQYKLGESISNLFSD